MGGIRPVVLILAIRIIPVRHRIEPQVELEVLRRIELGVIIIMPSALAGRAPHCLW